MKRKVFLAVVVLMCLAMVAPSALAQTGGRGSRESRGPDQGGRQSRGGAMMGRGGGMYEGLDLTKEQEAKIAKVREEIMEKARNADPEDRREIYGQMREKMQAILTPEQREKMAKRREEMGQRFSDRSGREGARPGREGARPGGPQRPGQDAGSRTRSMGPVQLLDGLLRRLGLNKEQQTKIAKIRADAIKKLFKDVKAVLTKEQNTKLDAAQKRLKAAQQRRPAAGRTGAGERPERRRPRRGEGEEGSRRGSGDRDGGARGRTRGEGGSREN